MAKISVQIGERFGRWTILSVDADDRCLCVCECGFRKVLKRTRLRVIPSRPSNHCRHDNLSLEERFWQRVKKGNGCWLWDRAHGRYGVIRHDGKLLFAHRLSWELHYGAIPDGLRILHKCDVTLCCRPDHLFLGTQVENIADMVAKGRQRGVIGSRHHKAKIDESIAAKVLKLFSLSKKNKGSRIAIARELDVPVKIVRRIISGESWRHVST